MTKRTAGLTLAALLLLTGSIYAHHSYAAFQTDQTVSIEGTVSRVDFVNPHVLLTIKTKDGDYTAEFPAINVLARNNFTASSLKVGDIVVAKGSPMKDTTIKLISLMKELRRPADGWVWPVAEAKPAQ